MSNILLIGALALAAPGSPVAQTDTTVEVAGATRLHVNNPGGIVIVRTWERAAVRVQAEHASFASVQIGRNGPVLSVHARGRRSRASVTEFDLTIPASMALELEGSYSDFDVAGVRGEVVIETLDGKIEVDGGRERIILRSVQGQILLSNAEGRIQARTVNEEITVSGSAGDLMAETVNGTIRLRDIQASTVEATTFNGDILYEGTIEDGGRYTLSTHNGDVIVAIPEETDATVSVGTARGDFSTSFPLEFPDLDLDRERRFSFTLGTGSATIELESFGGGIYLRRPGEVHDRQRPGSHLDHDGRRPERL